MALGAGTAALLAVGFGVVALHGPYNGDNSKPAPQSAAAGSNAPAGQNPGQNASVQPVANTFAVKLTPLPANAATIPDQYLEQLAMFVDLAGARSQAPNKAVWNEALPAAQKLIAGPCDCEQKIWLTHFIEMGNLALTDSTREYHETADLMATLGRNDEQAMELSKKPK
ncbi:MAG TPA: hypothetical protein VG733_20085 [Chthoniobacteraceae bacterium]|nr:hypothetical protein [Chthoniobacteraceae bacterium]